GKRPSSFHHGDLPDALIKAATGLVEREGASAVSLREAARIVGVSHTAPYRHFATREALLAAVAARGFQSLRQALNDAADGAGNVLLAMGQAYLTFALSNPELFRLMFASGLDRTQYDDLKSSADDAFAVLLQAAAARDTDAPEDAALGAWALVHGLAHLSADGQLPKVRQEEIRSGDLLKRVSMVYGLLPPPGRT
ncbi:MAG TPA: TetR/AcrR family transcriptional regulator, partial [Pseudorhizobium sp.]|nr:TetR/AcrR family transcriptional regulator [Pseudorhizobium sp.]